jgi:transposase
MVPATSPGSPTIPGATGVFGLPSLRALDASMPVRIWLCTQRTDMRCGFDRLAQLAGQVTGEDPLSGHLFVFHNRRRDRLKILYWDRDGYVLWYKRLEAGQFKLPRLPKHDSDQPAGSVSLRPSELAMLLEGIDLSSIRRSKRYRRAGSGP